MLHFLILFNKTLQSKSTNVFLSGDSIDKINVLKSAGPFFSFTSDPQSSKVYTLFDSVYTQFSVIPFDSDAILRSDRRDFIFLLDVYHGLKKNFIDVNVYKWFLRLYRLYLMKKLSSDEIKMDFGVVIDLNMQNIDNLIDSLSDTGLKRRFLFDFLCYLQNEVKQALQRKKESEKKRKISNYVLYLKIIDYFCKLIKKNVLKKVRKITESERKMNAVDLVLIPIFKYKDERKSVNRFIYVDSVKRDLNSERSRKNIGKKESERMELQDLTNSLNDEIFSDSTAKNRKYEHIDTLQHFIDMKNYNDIAKKESSSEESIRAKDSAFKRNMRNGKMKKEDKTITNDDEIHDYNSSIINHDLRKKNDYEQKKIFYDPTFNNHHVKINDHENYKHFNTKENKDETSNEEDSQNTVVNKQNFNSEEKRFIFRDFDTQDEESEIKTNKKIAETRV